MSENPYAPPSSDLGGGSRTDAGRSGDFEIGTCLSEAWSATWAGFPGWLGALLVSGICMTLSAITIVGIVLALPVLGWGAVLYFLNLHDRKASISDLFAGFSRYTEALVGMLVTILAVVVIGFVGQIVSMVGQLMESSAVIGIGALVNIAWAILVGPRFYFAYLYVVDRGESPMDAVMGSWERTAPVKWKVAGLAVLSGLAAFAIVFPAVLVLGIGVAAGAGDAGGGVAVILGGALFALLLTVPVVFLYLVWISAYRQMEGHSEPAAG